MPTKYVCAFSSLNPIDLTALAAYRSLGCLRQEDIVELLVVEDADFYNMQLRQVLSPHLSIATPLLVRNKPNYKQIFLPLFPDDAELNLRSLTLGVRAITDLTIPKLHYRTVDQLRDRTDALLMRNHSSSSKVIIGIAKYILSELLGCSISVDNYGSRILSELGQDQVLSSLPEIAEEVYNSYGERHFSFIDNGYVEITNKSRDFFAKLRSGYVTKDRLILQNDTGSLKLIIDAHRPLEIEINPGADLAPEILAPLLLRPRGIPELVYGNQIGKLLDMTWYCSEVSVSRSSCLEATEVISPVSVKSVSRTSVWAGGEGLRLVPSGYSLLEYEDPVILNFIRNVAVLEDADFNDFDDWRHLINNYPFCSQKVAKTQNRIPHYTHLRREEIQRELRQGSLKPIEVISMGDLTPTHIGYYSINLFTVLRFILDVNAPGPANFTQEQLARLEGLQLTDQGIPNPRRIRAVIQRALETSAAWRNSVSVDINEIVAYIDDNHANAHDIVEYVMRQKKSPERTTELSRRQMAIIEDIGDANYVLNCSGMLRDEYREYYRCVLALCALALKADIWTVWILLGPKFLSSFKHLAEAREGRNCIEFSARSWKLA